MKAGRTGLFVVGFFAGALSGPARTFGSDALVAHVSGVHALEFVDGQTLISGGSDGAVKRWKLDRPAEPHPLRGDAAAAKRGVKAIRFDATTNAVWVARSGGVVEAMGLDGHCRGKFKNPSPAPIVGLGFTGSGDVLAATGKWPHRDGQVLVLNPNDVVCANTVGTGSEGDVVFAAMGAEDKFLIGGSTGLALWSARRGKIEQYLRDEVLALAFHQPSQRAFVATTTARLDAVHCKGGKVSNVRQRGEEPYTKIAASEGGLAAASGRQLDLFQLRGDQQVISNTLNFPAEILSLAITKSKVAIGFADGGLWVMNLDTAAGWEKTECVDNEASVLRSDNLATLQSNRLARTERERSRQLAQGSFWHEQHEAKIAAQIAARQAWAKAMTEMANLEVVASSSATTGVSAKCGRCGCPCLLNAVACPRGCGVFTGTRYK